MKYFIPTYNQCREICDAYDNFTFYETKHVIDGYNISIFNYRLAMPSLFYFPIKDKPEITAHELRGLVFVFNSDDTIYNRFILMDKFFNLNQYDCSSYHLMKNEIIKDIAYKEDGSIASFIQLPNGRIVGRSKASFDSDQAIEVDKIYNANEYIKNLVDYCFENDIVPIFEYVSPKNRVVLKYSKTDLVLTKLRNNTTGKYVNISDLPSEKLEGVTIVKTFTGFTLDDLIYKCETEKDYEGFVVTFESGKMIKLKLLDYIALHDLHTEELNREDYIISMIVEETIDDILSQLEEGDERRDMIDELIALVNNYFVREVHNTEELIKKFKGDKKEFVLENKSNPYFAFAMSYINHKNDILETVKKQLLKDTYFLHNARKWIEKQKKLLT